MSRERSEDIKIFDRESEYLGSPIRKSLVLGNVHTLNMRKIRIK